MLSDEISSNTWIGLKNNTTDDLHSQKTTQKIQSINEEKTEGEITEQMKRDAAKRQRCSVSRAPTAKTRSSFGECERSCCDPRSRRAARLTLECARIAHDKTLTESSRAQAFQRTAGLTSCAHTKSRSGSGQRKKPESDAKLANQ